MKKINRAVNKKSREINIEKMDESTSKIFISTTRVTAVSENNRVQNYEDYINDKYLTGAIVRKAGRKNQKRFNKPIQSSN